MSDKNNLIPIDDLDNSRVINEMKFTKNFRSATAEEWYIFLPGFKDPVSGGAAGKAMIHYDLYGNKEIFINTTVILMILDFMKKGITGLSMSLQKKL